MSLTIVALTEMCFMQFSMGNRMMRISTSKTEAMVLCRKKVDWSLWAVDELLPQVKQFKYLRVLFSGDRKMECEMDWGFGATSAVMAALYQTVLVKRAGRQALDLPVDLCSNPNLWS